MRIPDALLQCLHDRLGLNPTSINAQSLINGITQRMKACGVDDPLRYSHIILRDQAEFMQLVEAVVVPETSFFRHPAAFQALRQLAQRHHGNVPLRVLCVPSSTGEEPYSVAMCLLQSGLSADGFTVDAVDISAHALQQAREGLYQQYSFRGAMVQQYMHFFKVTAQGYRISPDVQHCVRFHQANVLDESRLLAMGRYPVIFCRNLMIYLHAEARLQVAKTLGVMLEKDGTLFSGNAENSAVWHGHFQSRRIPMTFAMRHTHPMETSRSLPMLQTAAPPLRSSPVCASEAAPVQQVHTPMPAYNLASVRRAADQGDMSAVIEQCDYLLARQPKMAELYFYLALAHAAEGNTLVAIKKLRQAVYLQPDYQDALHHLALLLDVEGESQAAQRVRQRLLTVRHHAR